MKEFQDVRCNETRRDQFLLLFVPGILEAADERAGDPVDERLGHRILRGVVVEGQRDTLWHGYERDDLNAVLMYLNTAIRILCMIHLERFRTKASVSRSSNLQGVPRWRRYHGGRRALYATQHRSSITRLIEYKVLIASCDTFDCCYVC